MSQPPKGLREQKKQLTRQAIAQTTLRLTLDVGLENVTLDEIARIAFVAPRTVTNYFPHKEEAIVAAGSLTPEDVIERLAARPDGEEPLESLRQITIDFAQSLTADQLELHRQKLELGDRYPSVKPYIAARYQTLEERLSSELAVRTGTEVATDIYPRLLSATAVAALRLSLAQWAASDFGVDELVATVRTAFTHLQDGLPSSRGAA